MFFVFKKHVRACCWLLTTLPGTPAWRGIKASYNLTDSAVSFFFSGFPKCICYLLLKDTIIHQRHKLLNHAIVLTDNRIRTLIASEVIASSLH